jgi:hypothetical protein
MPPQQRRNCCRWYPLQRWKPYSSPIWEKIFPLLPYSIFTPHACFLPMFPLPFTQILPFILLIFLNIFLISPLYYLSFPFFSFPIIIFPAKYQWLSCPPPPNSCVVSMETYWRKQDDLLWSRTQTTIRPQSGHMVWWEDTLQANIYI